MSIFFSVHDLAVNTLTVLACWVGVLSIDTIVPPQSYEAILMRNK